MTLALSGALQEYIVFLDLDMIYISVIEEYTLNLSNFRAYTSDYEEKVNMLRLRHSDRYFISMVDDQIPELTMQC